MASDDLEARLDAVQVDPEPRVPRVLKHGEDLVRGDVLWYQGNDPNPEYVGGPNSGMFNMLSGIPPHLHRDAWATILEVRRQGGITAAIMIDEDGDQVPLYVQDWQLVTVRAT